MYKLSQIKLDRLAELLRSGESVREIAASVPCARRTVTLYRRMFLGDKCRCGRSYDHGGRCFARGSILREGNPICVCGKPTTHRGWCAYRFARSKKRQKVLARWGKGPLAQVISVPQIVELVAAPVKGFSMFDDLPKIELKQNTFWRRLDMIN